MREFDQGDLFDRVRSLDCAGDTSRRPGLYFRQFTRDHMFLQHVPWECQSEERKWEVPPSIALQRQPKKSRQNAEVPTLSLARRRRM